MNIFLNSYHNFYKEAGIYDSRVEFFELGARYLADKSNSIGDLSARYNIFLNIKELPVIMKDIKKTYIVLAFSCFDEFLDEIKKEILVYYGFEYSIGKEDTKYSKLKLILPEIGKSINENSFEENCVEYYRLIRNAFVHKSAKDNAKIQAIHKKMYEIERPDIYKKYKAAPSSNDKIEFEDFILLTVVLKNIVEKVSEECNPSMECILSKIDWNKIIKRITYLTERDRKIQAVKNILISEYYMNSIAEIDIIKILDQQDHW